MTRDSDTRPSDTNDGDTARDETERRRTARVLAGASEAELTVRWDAWPDRPQIEYVAVRRRAWSWCRVESAARATGSTSARPP